MSGYSLQDSPVYRRFLAGGAEDLRPSVLGAATVVGGGLASLLITTGLWMLSGAYAAGTPWSAAAGATLTGLSVAILAARWLGSRAAVLAGLAQLTSAQILLANHQHPATVLFWLAVILAMGLFALGNVPGRLPLVDQRWTRGTFALAVGCALLLAGPAGAAFVLVPCILFVALCADSRGFRFLADPVTVTTLSLVVVVWLALCAGSPGTGRTMRRPAETRTPVGRPFQAVTTARKGHPTGKPFSAGRLSCPLGDATVPRSLGQLPVSLIPWAPWAALALLAGLRQGHYATPFWRFLGCWLFGPALCTIVLGPSRAEPYLATLVPPVAILGAAGLSGLLARRHRRAR